MAQSSQSNKEAQGAKRFMTTIECAHLRLRPFSDSDLGTLHRIANEPGIFDYFPNPFPWSIEKTRMFIEGQLKHWEEYGYGWWGMESLDRWELVGWNGLQFLPDTGEVEVGYLMSRPYRGRGWTTEGVLASLRFGFENFGLASIIAIIHPDNAASQRVALKCGLALIDRNRYFGMDCFRYRIEADAFRRQRVDRASSPEG